MKVRLADLQAKLDNCEKKLQSRENDDCDGDEGSMGSPIQRRDSLRSSSSVELPIQTRHVPTEVTLSYSDSTTTKKSFEQEGFESPNPLLSKRRVESNGTGVDRQHALLLSTSGSVQEENNSKPGSFGIDGTLSNCSHHDKY